MGRALWRALWRLRLVWLRALWLRLSFDLSLRRTRRLPPGASAYPHRKRLARAQRRCLRVGRPRATDGAHRYRLSAVVTRAYSIAAIRPILTSEKVAASSLGEELAARDPVWDGEGWGCDRVACLRIC